MDVCHVIGFSLKVKVRIHKIIIIVVLNDIVTETISFTYDELWSYCVGRSEPPRSLCWRISQTWSFLWLFSRTRRSELGGQWVGAWAGGFVYKAEHYITRAYQDIPAVWSHSESPDGWEVDSGHCSLGRITPRSENVYSLFFISFNFSFYLKVHIRLNTQMETLSALSGLVFFFLLCRINRYLCWIQKLLITDPFFFCCLNLKYYYYWEAFSFLFKRSIDIKTKQARQLKCAEGLGSVLSDSDG